MERDLGTLDDCAAWITERGIQISKSGKVARPGLVNSWWDMPWSDDRPGVCNGDC